VNFVLVITIVVAGTTYPLNPSYFPDRDRCEFVRNMLFNDQLFKLYEAKGDCYKVTDLQVQPRPAPGAPVVPLPPQSLQAK
jgi:hypothetical protein